MTDAELARWEEKLRGAGTFHAVPPIAATDVLILLEEIRRLRAALDQIAAWSEGPVVTGRFDEPSAARIAREALAA